MDTPDLSSRASVLTLLAEVYGDKTTWVYSLTQVSSLIKRKHIQFQLRNLEYLADQTRSIRVLHSLLCLFHRLINLQTFTFLVFLQAYVFPGLIWVCRNLGSFCWGNYVRCWWLLTAIWGFIFVNFCQLTTDLLQSWLMTLPNIYRYRVFSAY